MYCNNVSDKSNACNITIWLYNKCKYKVWCIDTKNKTVKKLSNILPSEVINYYLQNVMSMFPISSARELYPITGTSLEISLSSDTEVYLLWCWILFTLFWILELDSSKKISFLGSDNIWRIVQAVW
jgi:hypothetical protein